MSERWIARFKLGVKSYRIVKLTLLLLLVEIGITRLDDGLGAIDHLQ